MKTLKFKTNIKCNGCINTVKPYLDEAKFIKNWSVDLGNPDRILTVETEEMSERITQLLQEAGYKAEKV